MRVTRAAIVLAGGDPVEPDLRERLVARRRASSSPPIPACTRARSSACTSTTSSAISTRPIPPRSSGPAPRARSSNAIRPRRMRPISSSRSTSRATAVRNRSPSSVVPAAASTTSSRTSRCSRRRASPISRSTPYLGDGYLAVVQGGRPPLVITGEAGSLVSLVPAGGARVGDHHDRAAVSAARRDPAAGNVARRQQRARRQGRVGRARTRDVADDPSLRRCRVKRRFTLSAPVALAAGRARRRVRQQFEARGAVGHHSDHGRAEDHDGHGCSRTVRSRRRRRCSPTSRSRRATRSSSCSPATRA